MAICLDLAVIVIILLTIIHCYRRGFARSALSFLSTIISVVLASYLGSWLSEMIYDNIIKEKIIDSIRETVSNNINSATGSAVQGKTLLPDYIQSLLSMFGYDTNNINSGISSAVETQTNNIAYGIESAFAPIIISICSFVLMILLFFLIRFIMSKLTGLVSKAMELPVLKTVNKVFGGLLGIAQGIVLVYFLVSLSAVLVPLVSGGNMSYMEFSQEAGKTVLFSIFYNHNIITSMLG